MLVTDKARHRDNDKGTGKYQRIIKVALGDSPKSDL